MLRNRRRRRRIAALAIASGVVLVGCAPGGDPPDADTDRGAEAGSAQRFRYPPAPESPAAGDEGAAATRDAIGRIGVQLAVGEIDERAVLDLAAAGDARHAWYVADLMRFFGAGDNDGNELVAAFEALTGTSISDDPDSERSVWLSATNHLIAWDTPAYPSYRDDKSVLFLLVEPAWEPFFLDADADIDWRYLSWGGVRIDDRELGDPDGCPQGCIPALDDPATTDVDGGDWYPDDAVVFGVVEGGEALAIPKNIAEIHEMFNLTLGDRRFGIPYCTLCGSAQAYRTDQAVEQGAGRVPVLRTSGLLSRSNKVMYDLHTRSVFDTFTGAAVSGPLHDAGVVLEETAVVRTTWGDWKAEHPDTTIIAEDGGIGRSYPLDPLGGRDDNGPIFPIGDLDERLGVQELVLGVIGPGGTPVAFAADRARDVLAAGGEVAAAGVALVVDGGGLRAIDATSGDPLGSHESFWFAWSQFHPATQLWQP